MVVSRTLILTCVVACASVAAWGQEARVSAWVETPIQTVEIPFWIFVEATGSTVGTPVIPDVDGLIINRTSPQTSQSFAMSAGATRQTIRLAYYATAVRSGAITIPPIEIVVNGKKMSTEPVLLTIEGGSTLTPSRRAEVRAWAESPEILSGKPFWFYIEATGGDVILPDRIEVDGLSIDTVNIMRSSSFSFGAGASRVTRKNGYHCTALRAGTIVVPPIQVLVDNVAIDTEPIVLTVRDMPDPSANRVADATRGTPELTKDDLLFIRMETDKREVYQGEAILLTQQLWRIDYPNIHSGPYRGSLIVPPSNEGFYATYLEPIAFKGERGAWKYDVSEERKVLYATAIGSLRVGQWHWEGVALINRTNVISREKLRYKLNAGPLDIKVKPLPKRPPGFSGAVGVYSLEASISTDSATQGIPMQLTVTVIGEGNPDAVGSPVLPELDWARIDEPERDTQTYLAPGTNLPTVEKRFVFTIVPLLDGDLIIPEVTYIYFDPEQESYVHKKVGPFHLIVAPSTEQQRHLIVADDIELEQRGVEILAEDIHPIITHVNPLQPHRPSPLAVPAAVAFPLVGYASVVLVMARRRRFEHDTGFARAYRARARALSGIGEVARSSVPGEALYRALIGFVSDSFDLAHGGLTSQEVDRILSERGVDDTARVQLVKILRACERVKYASQHISKDELNALIQGAESSIQKLDRVLKQVKKT
ncbi:MAG: BatD family protein [Candidatus Hydrogenedentes bacterium]|nr:BatD family protein [Candidatus Hydrogenedentota bacterium]